MAMNAAIQRTCSSQGALVDRNTQGSIAKPIGPCALFIVRFILAPR
jgi:hypothetical protein